MAEPSDQHRRFWLSRARREQLRFNLGWWLQLYLPWIFAVGLAAAALLLAVRTAGVAITWIGAAGIGTLVVGAGVAFWRARRRFLSTDETLTRLDADARLYNALTTARVGVAGWPAPVPAARLLLQWHWLRLCWPPAAALVLMAIAAYIPIPEEKVASAAPSLPPAWTEMEEKIDALAETELVEEEAREEFREAVEALRQKPPEEWYSHESLEAGDHLQAQLNENLASLEKSLSQALGAMEAARQLEQGQFDILQPGLDQALQEAAQALQQGKMPLDSKLMEKLQSMNAAEVRQISAEEWKAMQARMQEGVATASDGQNAGEKSAAAVLAALAKGNTPGAGGDSDQPGVGGVTRGPGSAPLTMSDQETRLGTNKTESLASEDLSRATLGDPAGLGQGRHEVDTSLTVPTAGGAMSSAGQGGQATWQQSATPDEQAALQRFFK